MYQEVEQLLPWVDYLFQGSMHGHMHKRNMSPSQWERYRRCLQTNRDRDNCMFRRVRDQGVCLVYLCGDCSVLFRVLLGEN